MYKYDLPSATFYFGLFLSTVMARSGNGTACSGTVRFSCAGLAVRTLFKYSLGLLCPKYNPLLCLFRLWTSVAAWNLCIIIIILSASITKHCLSNVCTQWCHFSKVHSWAYIKILQTHILMDCLLKCLICFFKCCDLHNWILSFIMCIYRRG